MAGVSERIPTCFFPITPKDMYDIEHARDATGAVLVICNVVKRMPEPHILVLEPGVTGNHRLDNQWLLAFDLAVTLLAEEGGVIDSSWLRMLAECNPEVAKKYHGTKVRLGEEVFGLLLTKRLIDTVYIPDEDTGVMSAYHRSIIREAKEPKSFPYRQPFEIGFYKLAND